MIYHGDWELYTPAPLPEGWPEWASYARRVSDGVDWYQWTREHWNVQNGADTTGTMKVQVVDNVAISKCPDVTGLGFTDFFSLYELEEGDTIPGRQWVLVNGQFQEP